MDGSVTDSYDSPWMVGQIYGSGYERYDVMFHTVFSAHSRGIVRSIMYGTHPLSYRFNLFEILPEWEIPICPECLLSDMGNVLRAGTSGMARTWGRYIEWGIS